MPNINYYICEELILNNLPIDSGSLSTILEQIAFSLYTNRANKDYLRYDELSAIIQNYKENYPSFHLKTDKLVNNYFLGGILKQILQEITTKKIGYTKQ